MENRKVNEYIKVSWIAVNRSRSRASKITDRRTIRSHSKERKTNQDEEFHYNRSSAGGAGSMHLRCAWR